MNLVYVSENTSTLLIAIKELCATLIKTKNYIKELMINVHQGISGKQKFSILSHVLMMSIVHLPLFPASFFCYLAICNKMVQCKFSALIIIWIIMLMFKETDT